VELTEKDAATAYARAWNRLECTEFLELLAPDAIYESQWVFNELAGKDVIADYLIHKLEAVKNAGNKVFAELGITRLGSFGRDCVFIAQGKKEEVKAVVLFKVADDKIQRYDLCVPELYDVDRSGIYPI